MKNIIAFYGALIFLLSLNATVVNGQGWGRTIWSAPSTVTGFSSNEVITAAMHQNGQYVALGLSYQESSIVPSPYYVKENLGVGFSSGLFFEGLSNDITHIPITILNANDPADTAFYFLTQRSLPGDDTYYLNLSRFVNSDDTPATPLVVDFTQVLIQSELALIGKDMIRTSNGDLLVLAETETELVSGGDNIREMMVIRTDPFGNIIWIQTYVILGDDNPIKIKETDNSNYHIVYQNIETISNLYLLTIDEVGAIVSDELIPNSTGLDVSDVTKTSDNALAITGANASNDLFVLKIGLDAQPIWLQEYTTPTDDRQGNGITEDPNGNLIIAGVMVDDAIGEPDAMIAKLTSNGTPLWERDLGRVDRASAFNNIVIMPGGQYNFSGFIELNEMTTTRAAWFLQTDTMGVVKGGLLKGNVFYDELQDCINVDELNLEKWIVTATSATDTIYAQTDENGNYSMEIDLSVGETIDYIISLTPSNPYWEVCENNVPVSLSYLSPDSVDFGVQALVNCAFIDATLSSTNVRPCEDNVFVIDYCNNGTILIDDASFELTLDDDLSFVSSAIPPTTIDGQTLTWEVGTLLVNDCGQIPIVAFTDCDSVSINDILCLDLMVSPDTICYSSIQSTDWSGALLELDYTCTEDNLIFNITNRGTASMIDVQDYIIIEDAVLREQNDFNLLPGETINTPELPLNGATYHILAPQEPGAPGVPLLSISTMNCMSGPSGPNNQILQNNGDPFHITFCPIVVGSFDPNDKTAYPIGLTEEHIIPSNTELQYTIRFQNTGTDTAFRVVLLDTLSSLLNPATIVPGAASHPYTWDLSERGILAFNFYDIELPDSLTNPAGSQGYVTFTVDQQRNLSGGTVIENTAAIYFDYNDPIITNTTFHTIFDYFDIVSGTVETATPKTEVTIIPNPMKDGAWLKLAGVDFSTEPMVVIVYDATGQEVYTVTGFERVWLPRNNLTPGMYFFTAKNSKGWLASGKLIAQ